MKNSEEAIDRVLTGLRDAEVSVGMEARILRVMESRGTETKSVGRWQQWKTGRGHMWRPAAGAAAAGVCALAIFGVAMHDADHVAFRGPGVPRIAGSGSLAGMKESVPPRLKPLASSKGYGTAEAMPLSKTAGLSTEDEGRVDYDSLAVSEMLAPSKPAPLLSLTQQENLLAQVVHLGDPEVVAELKPEVRAKEIEIAKAEFYDFFEPSLPAAAKESK